MTARCYPAQVPKLDGRVGEYQVWTHLRDNLPDEAVLLYSVHVPDGANGREIDLLVLWPGIGIGVIEVKGGKVTCSPDGRWRSERGDRPARDIENPMEQVATARHRLHRFLVDSGKPGAHARMQHLVVLPHVRLDRDFNPTSCPRNQLVDEVQLAKLVPILKALIETGAGHAPLEPDDLAALVTLFTQELPEDLQAFTREEEQRADQLTSQQVDVLDLLSRQQRFTIIGGAGSGKTVLALEQAKRLAAQGKRVALVCYSRGLGRYLQHQVATWDQPATYVGLFHDLAKQWGAPEGADSNDYYEEVLPTALGELARAREQRFDAIVVDEGQDFGEQWWTSMTACLQDPEDGGLFVFMDEDQRVFRRQGTAPVDVAPYPLRRNFRNTKRIAQTFSSLATERQTPLGRAGPRVRFVPCATAEVIDRASDAVDGLIGEWEPHQIALLTTKHRHPEHARQVESLGVDGYWDGYFADQEEFYSTVSSFKGLERTCVVLAVNGFNEDAQAKEMLYVGLSRARSLLVVVGDLEDIARVGGGGVRSRLEQAQTWQP
ncbi:MAG: NERD domain-containing protein [Mycobacteriales bacterium]